MRSVYHSAWRRATPMTGPRYTSRSSGQPGPPGWKPFDVRELPVVAYGLRLLDYTEIEIRLPCPRSPGPAQGEVVSGHRAALRYRASTAAPACSADKHSRYAGGPPAGNRR